METITVLQNYLEEQIELEELAQALYRIPHERLRGDPLARRAMGVLAEATSADLDEETIVLRLRQLVVTHAPNHVTRTAASGHAISTGSHRAISELGSRVGRTQGSDRTHALQVNRPA